MTNDNRPPLEPLMTTAEVADAFRVNPKTIAIWAKAGKLTAVRTLGGHRRYRETQVRALLDMERPRTAGGPAPSAHISIGADGGDLYWTPQAGQVPVPGTAAIILGWTVDGQAVTLATTSLAWLDDLESAVQLARAQGIVEAGMTVPA